MNDDRRRRKGTQTIAPVVTVSAQSREHCGARFARRVRRCKMICHFDDRRTTPDTRRGYMCYGAQRRDRRAILPKFARRHRARRPAIARARSVATAPSNCSSTKPDRRARVDGRRRNRPRSRASRCRRPTNGRGRPTSECRARGGARRRRRRRLRSWRRPVALAPTICRARADRRG